MSNEKKKESGLLFLGMAVILMVLGFVSYKNKSKRNQIEEIKKLPFHNVQLVNVEDGIYTGETATSFLYVVMDVEVENHQFKNIQLTKMNGKKINNLESIVNRMVEENSIIIEAKRGQEIETFVLMSCVDSALYKTDKAEELSEANEKN